MHDSVTDRQGARVARPRRLVMFLAAAFALTWLAFLPLILRRIDPESIAGVFLLVLGVGAPSLIAVVYSALGDGRAGIRRLWRGGTRWRVRAGWYAAVVVVPGLAHGAAWAAAASMGMQTPFNPLAPALVSGLLAGILEEFGWSGFAFPMLHARYGFLRAGVAMGFIVALWHLPFFLLPGTTQSTASFPLFLLTLIAVRIIFGWVYIGSGQSVLLTVLLHASGNAWSEVLGQGPGTADAPGLAEALVFWVVAVTVLLSNRRDAPGHGPR